MSAHIPERYVGCSFKTFQISASTQGARDQLVRAKAVSEAYVEDFVGADGRFSESGLLFMGPPGVGKTHLAVAVLKELISRYNLRGLFIDFTSLIHRIQSTFEPGSSLSKEGLLGPMKRAELLVLDELGAQKPGQWVTEILYLIVNSRYNNRLPTIFTSNYRLNPEAADAGASLDRPMSTRGHASLDQRISPGLLSRLYEMARAVEIDSSDFRLEVQAQKHSF